MDQHSFAVDAETDIKLFEGRKRGAAVHINGYAEINSAKVGISASSLPMILSIVQNFGIRDTNEPLGSSISSKSVASIYDTHVKNACGMVRTGTSSSSAALSSALVLRHDSASAAWYSIAA